MLKKGIFKYKEICEMMGWDKKTGKGKVLQIESLKEYCDFEKGEKATFIIKEVYSRESIIIPEKRGLYNTEVAYSLLAVISKKRKEEGVNYIYATPIELLIMSNIASDSLYDRNYELEGFSKAEAKDYKVKTANTLYRAIENGLKVLKSNKIIDYSIVKMVKVDCLEAGIINRKCCMEENVAILESEQKVLEQMDIRSIYVAIMSDRYEEYKELVIKNLKEEFNMGYIINFFNAYEIITTKRTESHGQWVLKNELKITKDVWEATHKALCDGSEERAKRYGDIARKIKNEYSKSNMKVGFNSEEDSHMIDSSNNRGFINVIYGYEDYVSNFKELDRKIRKPKIIK